MRIDLDNATLSRVRALCAAALARPAAPATLPARLLLCDAERQQMYVLVDGRPLGAYVVSTARNGIGGEVGSYRTPPGWHRINSRIGEGQPLGEIFVARQPVGEVWSGGPGDHDLVLTRVMWLEGVEEGINRGPGCDSLERFIYIHGTNHEELLGQPASHGCVRMFNADVVELFDWAEPGDMVVIVPSAP
jgi:UDP-N-acetylmuramate--alanine ligase